MRTCNVTRIIPNNTKALTAQFQTMDMYIALNPQVFIGSPTKEHFEALAEEVVAKLSDSNILDRQLYVSKVYAYYYECKFCRHYFDLDDKEAIAKPTCCDQAIDTWDPERLDDMWKEEV